MVSADAGGDEAEAGQSKTCPSLPDLLGVMLYCGKKGICVEWSGL
ncbi:hypothetical protein [Streptomyces nitrosporeus]